MNRLSHLCLMLALLLNSIPAAADTTAVPANPTALSTDPYRYTGLIYADGALGSGAVVKNPSVVLSCAHVVYDDSNTASPWVSDVLWFRDYNSSAPPSLERGTPLRGYFHFGDYSSNVQNFGSNSPQAFFTDFVAHYALRQVSGGGSAQLLDNGVGALTTRTTKIILGYPIGLYRSGDSRRFKMHVTGPFTAPMASELGNYLSLDGVSTGAGNSGGPVFVAQGDSYRFSGVLVSGLEKSTGDPINSIGVYAFDPPASQIVDRAIARVGAGGATPDIRVLGNNRDIVTGDTRPSALDYTEFRSASGAESSARRFLIRDAGDAPLTIGKATLAGVSARYFRIAAQPASSLQASGQTSIVIEFRRSPKGAFSARVKIPSNDPDEASFEFVVRARRR